MKRMLFLIVFFMISSIVIGCERERSGTMYKGEGENWSAELMTKYNFWGKEMQSIRLEYIGEEKLKVMTETNLTVESTDFLGWGLKKIDIDESGLYDSGEVFMYDNKTPSSAKITLTIDGQDSEVLLLSSTSP